jgi:spore germination cell wall hydrolase CwlJ-like protein
MDMMEAQVSLNCMAVAMYAEGSTIQEKQAVGYTIMNRLRSGKFGKDVCEVVYSNKNGKFQFEGIKDITTGKHQFPTTKIILEHELIAWDVMFKNVPNPISETAFFFHDDSIKNPWNLKKITKIGALTFY